MAGENSTTEPTMLGKGADSSRGGSPEICRKYVVYKNINTIELLERQRNMFDEEYVISEPQNEISVQCNGFLENNKCC